MRLDNVEVYYDVHSMKIHFETVENYHKIYRIKIRTLSMDVAVITYLM